MTFIKRVRRYVKWHLSPRALIWNFWRVVCQNKPIIANLRKGGKVRIYPQDVIGMQIYIDGAFESEAFEFVSRFLKPGMTVFDLGANLGQYTVLAASCVGSMGRVHSFEPNKRMFQELQFNVVLNNIVEMCTLNRFAVSDKNGIAKLSSYTPGAEVYGSIGTHSRIEASVIGTEEVQTLCIDEYVEERNITQVHFMKIDIEGAELLALRGAKKLLANSNAPVILIELADVNTIGFGYKAVETWNFLVELGYKIYSLRMEPLQRPDDFNIAQDIIAMK